MRTLILTLLLTVTVGSTAPARWKVSYINDVGFTQFKMMPGRTLSDAVDAVMYNDPQAVILSACHVDYAECGAKGEIPGD